MLALVLLVAAAVPTAPGASPPGPAPTRAAASLPAIVVTNPSAPLTWLSRSGRMEEVRWRSAGPVGGVVRITLERPRCAAEVRVLAAATPNTGSLWVETPGSLAPGVYAVRVSSPATGAAGCSADFNVAVSTFTCIEPAAGAQWRPGGRQRVAWASSEPPSATLDISLMRPADATGFRFLARATANDGEELVALPADVPAGAYKLAFEVTGPAGTFTYFSPVFTVGAVR